MTPFARLFLGIPLRSGKLQEYLFQAHGGGTKFVQVPTGFDHRAGQIAADKALPAFDLEAVAVVPALLNHDPAHARDLFEPLLHGREIEAAIASADFDQHRFGAASAILQIVHRVGRDQLAFVDDEHLLAGLLDFGQNVSAENDGVVAAQALDQVSSFVDLLRIETGRRLIENQHVRVVNDRLRQTYTLAIAFRQFTQQLVLHIRNRAPIANVIDSLAQLRAREPFELADEGQVFARLHLRIERRGFGKIADALLDFERLLQNIEAGYGCAA